MAVFQFNSGAFSGSGGLHRRQRNDQSGRRTNTSSECRRDQRGRDRETDGDYTFVIGHLVFAPNETQKTIQVLISDDGYAEGNESATLLLQNPSNGTLGATSAATLQIIDNSPETASNPIDLSSTFVCQQYHDFLYRESDTAGQDFWTNNIESCGANAPCRQAKRVDTSAAFFLSIEFNQTGFLVIRAHKAGFGNAKGVPRYDVFLRDQREIGEGVVVGQANWESQLNANTQNYLNDFVRGLSSLRKRHLLGAAGTYVDALFTNSGVTPTANERNAAIAAYGSGDTAGRAAALKSVLESGSVFNAAYNPSFVLMEYFGYLRRNPDDPPDGSFIGYDFWLDKMVSPRRRHARRLARHRRAARAEMVRLIESIEYRQRFYGSSSGNQFAPPDEGAMTRFIKGVVRLTLFGVSG